MPGDSSNTADGWLSVQHDGTSWLVDSEFFRSSWTCIWDQGCLGIEQESAPEMGLGCCSVGAELLDDDEAMRVAALASTIDPENFQFHDEFVERGAFAEQRTASGHQNTLVVDGACVFLNRPGAPGGHGCVLHAEALREGESPIDWKPSICWQLPIQIERSEDRSMIRRRTRSDWGDGVDMAWCCTEGEEAFRGAQPVHESLREELTALLGTSLLAKIEHSLGRTKPD